MVQFRSNSRLNWKYIRCFASTNWRYFHSNPMFLYDVYVSVYVADFVQLFRFVWIFLFKIIRWQIDQQNFFQEFHWSIKNCHVKSWFRRWNLEQQFKWNDSQKETTWEKKKKQRVAHIKLIVKGRISFEHVAAFFFYTKNSVK